MTRRPPKTSGAAAVVVVLLLSVVFAACGEAEPVGPRPPIATLRTITPSTGHVVHVLTEGAGEAVRPGDHVGLLYRLADVESGAFASNEVGLQGPLFVTLAANLGDALPGVADLADWVDGARPGERRWAPLGAAGGGRPTVLDVTVLPLPDVSIQVLDVGRPEGRVATSGARLTLRLAMQVGPVGTGAAGSPKRTPAMSVRLQRDGGLIEGMYRGLLGMRVGEIRRVEVPAVLGYGAVGRPPDIPPDSDLCFEVELLAVEAD